ncbi:MAG: type IV pilin protein [Dechloromonas sp.]|nr:type IV pilin protein [Dechloromonas sp.]
MKCQSKRIGSEQGFSLIELMVVVVIIGILTSIAIPSYTDYVRRSRAASALGELSSWAARMEQSYLDNRNYGAGACRIAAPTLADYAMACALTNGGQGFTLTATAQINNEGGYTLREGNQKGTTVFKGGAVAKTCWLVKGDEC